MLLFGWCAAVGRPLVWQMLLFGWCAVVGWRSVWRMLLFGWCAAVGWRPVWQMLLLGGVVRGRRLAARLAMLLLGGARSSAGRSSGKCCCSVGWCVVGDWAAPPANAGGGSRHGCRPLGVQLELDIPEAEPVEPRRSQPR